MNNKSIVLGTFWVAKDGSISSTDLSLHWAQIEMALMFYLMLAQYNVTVPRRIERGDRGTGLLPPGKSQVRGLAFPGALEKYSLLDPLCK